VELGYGCVNRVKSAREVERKGSKIVPFKHCVKVMTNLSDGELRTELKLQNPINKVFPTLEN